MQADTFIPRRLDDQWKIGLWDADIAIPFLFSIFVGYTAGTKIGFIVCAGIGFWLSRAMARIKADKHPSYAMHWAYWALPTNPITAMRATPPSHIRRMVG